MEHLRDTEDIDLERKSVRDIKAVGEMRGRGWQTPEDTAEFRSTEGRRILLRISRTLRKGHKSPSERNWRRLEKTRGSVHVLSHTERIYHFQGVPHWNPKLLEISPRQISLARICGHKHHYHQPNGRGFDLILDWYEPHCIEINLGNEKEKT